MAVRHPGGWGPLSTGGASWRGGGTGALEGDVLVVDLHFTVLGPRVEEDEEWSTCVASSYQRMEEIPARLAPFAAVPDPVRTWRAAHPGQELRGWSEVSADLLEVFTAVTPERLAELRPADDASLREALLADDTPTVCTVSAPRARFHDGPEALGARDANVVEGDVVEVSAPLAALPGWRLALYRASGTSGWLDSDLLDCGDR